MPIQIYDSRLSSIDTMRKLFEDYCKSRDIKLSLTRSPTKLEFTMNIQNPGTSPAFFTAESAPMMYIREVAELPTLTFTIT